MNSLSGTLLFTIAIPWLFLQNEGKRTPVDTFPGHDKIWARFYPIPETCPDECIYIEKCGKSDPDSMDKNYFATGNGLCMTGRNLDKTYCPITDYNECIIKCGGTVCAFPDNFADLPANRVQGKGQDRSHGDQDLLNRTEAYRKLNDTSIDFLHFVV